MARQAKSLLVWDGLVRLLHWLLVIAVAVAWLSTLGRGWSKLHEPAGWVAISSVLLRVLWGFIGSHYARFMQFIRSPAIVADYARQLLTKSAPRYLGHNPLGGWMIIALLTSVFGAGFSGWLFTTDMFWGTRWLQLLHSAFAWFVVVLAVFHIGGVIFASSLHRENLVRAMFTGRKAMPQPSDRI